LRLALQIAKNRLSFVKLCQIDQQWTKDGVGFNFSGKKEGFDLNNPNKQRTADDSNNSNDSNNKEQPTTATTTIAMSYIYFF